MGFVNKELENKNPAASRTLTRVAFAPQFTRTKYELLGDAMTKGGKDGNLARRAVIGKYGAEASLAMALGYLMRQKSNSIRDILINTLVHPSISTPFKNSKGNNIQLSEPSNFTSELGDLFTNLGRDTQGRLTVKPASPSQIYQGINQYVNGRVASLPRAAYQAWSNQDYYGNPIRDPSTSIGNQIKQTAENVGKGVLPIGIQGVSSNTSGFQNPVTNAALGMVGLTPRTDYTTGKGLQTEEYFKSLDDITSKLSPTDQKIFTGLIHSKSNTVDKYQTLLNHPTLLAAEKKLQLAQSPHDPMWDLSPEQMHSFLSASVISKNDPGGDSKTTSSLYATLPQDFFTKRDAYYNQLQKSGQMTNAPQPFQKPVTPPEVTSFWSAYDKLPYGTGARTQALRTKIGQEALAFSAQNKSITNQQRIDMGLPTLATSSSGYSSSSGRSRKLYLRKPTLKKEKLSIKTRKGKKLIKLIKTAKKTRAISLAKINPNSLLAMARK
jgi:hypothetical protein